MRLINYGTGEILDRLSILGLKLIYGGIAGRDTKHFRDERNALLTQLSAKNTMGRPVVLEHAVELFAVNAALWAAEDTLRSTKIAATAFPQAMDWQEAATCAFRIQTLNDRRAELIGLINVNTAENVGQEKLT